MKRPARRRSQKTRIFVGGEGQSECNYVRWLANLCRDRKAPVFIDIHDFGYGGAPLKRIDLATKKIKIEETNREKYRHKFIFLDTDQLNDDETEMKNCADAALRNGLTIIWQHPTHEGFLLRHFAGYENRQPPTDREALRLLKQCWETYQKPMRADQIEQMLTPKDAWRAAQTLPTFQQFLEIINLLANT